MRTLLRLLASLPVAIIGMGLASGAPSPLSLQRPLPSRFAANAPIGARTAAAPVALPNIVALLRTTAVSTDSITPALRIPLPHSLLIAPHGCASVGDRFDVLIHFHGAFTTVEPRLLESGIDGVYLVQNLGNGSGAYEDAYAGKGSLGAELEVIRNALNQRCGGPARSIARVALSGWSAGYGAIYRILARPAEAERVDAVLLADGMHVGYEPGSRRVRAAAMAPYLAFAAASVRGERLMAVTHSAIVPPGYASTTATAEFLVRELALDPTPAVSPEPRPGMRATSSNARGGLSIEGFAGGDAHAHCDHLYAIGDTLWPQLRERWAAK